MFKSFLKRLLTYWQETAIVILASDNLDPYLKVNAFIFSWIEIQFHLRIVFSHLLISKM